MVATRKIQWISLLALMIGFSAGSWALESNLPVLLEVPPDRLYRILGPVGATQKEVSQARDRLRLEAKKMNADAVIGVICQEGGFRREGLTWAKVDAYCRGMGVKYIEEKAND